MKSTELALIEHKKETTGKPEQTTNKSTPMHFDELSTYFPTVLIDPTLRDKFQSSSIQSKEH
ncbi:hypothetical protein [Vibrio sp. R78045]|uniref:hypothetical protein n=1 Tax=Vibrio sp. R78045 TaxID=3093868 RepID=UPI0036F39EC9